MTPNQYYEIRLQEESTNWNLFCGCGGEYFSGLFSNSELLERDVVIALSDKDNTGETLIHIVVK